jgi:hypothetical protein
MGNPFIPGTAPAYLDHVRTTGANDVDLSLFKSFHMAGERDLRFEISSFNIANKVQLAAPIVSTATNGFASFGSIGGDSNSPRQFQFGSRFTF